MRQAERILRGALHDERVRWLARNKAPTRLLAYDGPAHFVARHGELHEPEALPIVGAPRACFGNSIVYAKRFALDYIEGYAMLPSGFHEEPIHHAWVRDPETGASYELTWPAPGAVYLGVSFSVGRADDATWNGDASVLDDFNRGWPLLRSPWQGEDDSLEWPGSPAMETIESAIESGVDPIGNVAFVRDWLAMHRERSSIRS